MATFSRRPEANDLVKFCWFALYTGAATDSATLQFLNGLWSFKFPFAEWLPFTSWPLFHCLQPFCLLINLYLEALTDVGEWVKCIRCSYIQKLMNQFLLFTVGPLLLSVKGIIDLAQMPPTILLPHLGGTGTPTLERIAYLPGAQPPFPPRGFNPTSISPGEDPSLPNPSPLYPSPSPPWASCSLTSLLVQPHTCPGCWRSVFLVQSKLSLSTMMLGDV